MQNGYGQQSGDFQSDKLSAREIQARGEAILGVGVPKSAPPMDVSMRSLGQNIERLMQAIQGLQNKLEPVLYPEPPQPAGSQAAETRAPRASSNLGTTINNFSDQLELLTDRVNSMTRRCEL